MKRKKNSRLSRQAKRKLKHEVLCLMGTMAGIIASVSYKLIPQGESLFVFVLKFCSRFGIIYALLCFICFLEVLNDMSYFKKD